jgi:hypothetical protein
VTSLPWADWQFWVVTVAAAAGLWRLVQPLLARRPKGEAACGHCAAGAAACAAKPARDRLAAPGGEAGTHGLRVLRDGD